MKHDPILRVEDWPIENLIPYDLNAKKHDRDQINRLVTEISRHGFDVPIVVDRYGVIIKGHGRRLALMELGKKTAKVLIRSDLTPEEVRAARLGDNRTAISDIDPEVLRREIADLNADLSGVFDVKELEYLKADLGTMNVDAFVDDMDMVLEDQRLDTETRKESAKGEGVRVPLSKAFGFKDISAGDQFAVARFMARAEACTGLQNGNALVQYLAQLETTE